MYYVTHNHLKYLKSIRKSRHFAGSFLDGLQIARKWIMQFAKLNSILNYLV